jgi:hypothetical protein
MRHRTLGLFAAALLIFSAGCKKGANENEQIRTAIVKRLTERGTLNMAAFDTELKQVSIQGDKAQAEVLFRSKGGPEGAQMQMSYSLEKHDGVWAVLDSKSAAGAMGHPPMDGAQGQPGSPAADAIKNFHGQTEGAPGALPPGHPPIQAAPQTPPAPDQKKKP